MDSGDTAVLCIGMYFDGDKVIGLFNFSEYDKTVRIQEDDEDYVDMISGKKFKYRMNEIQIPAYGFYYLKKK